MWRGYDAYDAPHRLTNKGAGFALLARLEEHGGIDFWRQKGLARLGVPAAV